MGTGASQIPGTARGSDAVKSLVIYLTGPSVPALIRSMAFSFVGVLVIPPWYTLPTLVPNWEDTLPPHPRLAAEPASSLVTLAQG